MRRIIVFTSIMALTATFSASAQAADRQAPTVTITRPKSATTYTLNQAVTASYSCQDNRRVASCVGTVPNGQRIATSAAGTYTFSVKATDNAGNSTTKSVTYKVGGDMTAPTITITAPAANTTYTVGQSVTAQYACADTGSGMGTCTGTVANGAALDTSSGSHTFTVTATDVAGNTASKSVTYTVQAAPAPGDCSGYYGLTFDDGPNTTYTPQILAALKTAGVKATFFLIGENVAAAPTLAKQEVLDRHVVANHTYTHPDLTTLNSAQVRDQLTRTSTAIQSATGVTPTFVRPPYGEFNDATSDVFTALGLANTIWTNDTNDWDRKSVSQIISAAVAVKPGGIILMHDAYPNTVTALPQIIAQLKSKGMCPGKLAVSGTAVEAAPAWPGVFYNVVAVKP